MLFIFICFYLKKLHKKININIICMYKKNKVNYDKCRIVIKFKTSTHKIE